MSEDKAKTKSKSGPPSTDSAPTTPTDGPDRKRAKKGRSTSCYLCQKRKQKCDQRFPSCTNCLRAHVKCVQPPRYGESQRPHVKDEYTVLLEKKVKQLEKILDSTTKNEGNYAELEEDDNERDQTDNKYRKIGNLLDQTPVPVHLVLPFDQFDHVLNKPYDYFVADNTEKIQQSLVSKYQLNDFLHYEPVFDQSEPLSKQLIDIYFAMLQYKFPLCSEQEVIQFHNDYYARKTFSNHADYHFRAARMFLIHAISALLYKATGRYGGPHPYRFLSSALRHMVFFHNLDPLKRVEIQILLCFLVNRTEKDSNCLYTIIKDTMKTCAQLNLHRQKAYKNVSATIRERHMRCFWCAYLLERSISIATARPFSLREVKVDKELPLFERDPCKPSHPRQGISFINQSIKIRRLEAQFIEDLNILSSSSIVTRDQLPRVQLYFEKLQDWRQECQGIQPGKENETLSVYYYRAVRNLIQPFLELLDPDDKLFKECQAAAGQICQAIKAFHQKTVSGQSILNIHTAFTSGVTLIYCLWLERNRDDMKRKLMGDDKKHTRPPVSAALFSGLDDLKACSISLYVMAERTKFAISFRDSFDELMHATIDNLILRCGPNSSEILTAGAAAVGGMPPAVYRQPMKHYQMDSKFIQKTAAEKLEDEERSKVTGNFTRLTIPKGLSHLLSPGYQPLSPLTTNSPQMHTAASLSTLASAATTANQPHNAHAHVHEMPAPLQHKPMSSYTSPAKTPTSTSSSSSANTPAVSNTPVIPELLPFVGRTTTMINNISVWTGESGQQIPQTGLVMMQQQQQQQQQGSQPVTSSLFIPNWSDQPDGNDGTVQGPAYPHPAYAYPHPGYAQIQHPVYPPPEQRPQPASIDVPQWNSYPVDEFWASKTDLGFIP